MMHFIFAFISNILLSCEFDIFATFSKLSAYFILNDGMEIFGDRNLFGGRQ